MTLTKVNRKLNIFDDEGGKVGSTCEISPDGKNWVITLHSRGGKIGGPSERNPGYKRGLELIFERLAENQATIIQALLDSAPSQTLSLKKRQLLKNIPKKLNRSSDAIPLAKELMAAAVKIKTTDKKTTGGNPTKKIRIVFSIPKLNKIEDVEAIVLNASPPARKVFILTWNPSRTEISEESLKEYAMATEQGDKLGEWRWSTGGRSSGIDIDDIVFLFRQGPNERGIIASGVATSEVYEDKHWEDLRKKANYIDIDWTKWLVSDDRLPIEKIDQGTPNTQWNSMQGSGTKLEMPDAEFLIKTWEKWLEKIGSTALGDVSIPGDESIKGYSEGALKTVKVNRYERSSAARKKCIDEYGAKCACCNIDFSKEYGKIGKGFIHVHHIDPISSAKKNYKLDPIKDLIPVCPNCHAMLHKGADPPRTVPQLKKMRRV